LLPNAKFITSVPLQIKKVEASLVTKKHSKIMNTNKWLSFNGLSKVVLTLFFAFAWASCADNSVAPVVSDKAAARVGDDGISTTESYSQNVTLADGHHTWSYTLTSTVVWTGSTTTWTYTVGPYFDATNTTDGYQTSKNLSHILFGHFTTCATPAGQTFEAEGGGTGCNPGEDVIKYPNLTTPNFTVTYTYVGAFEVDPSAGTIYIKASTACLPISIPGPSCNTLGLTGKVNQKTCNGVMTADDSALAGATVTATQGTTSHTATTAADGSYSFDNIGGVWTVSATGVFAGASASVEVGPNDGVAALMTVDNRINGSCASISGHADRTDCVNQAAVTTPYAGATVTAGTYTATTDASGNFTINNVANGTYSVTINGLGHDVTVSGSQGANAAGTYALNFITGICGGTEAPACSLSQGYWFAKPQSVWGTSGTVNLGGKIYNKAEGVAIWTSSNKGGLLNAKAAFTQAAAIKLSGVAASASVWADVAIIDGYLATVAKLSPTSLPKDNSMNAAAGAAAGRIGSWIDSHHCTEK
jgi:hypothetical protein